MTLQSDIAHGILREAASSEHGTVVELHDIPGRDIVGKAFRCKQVLYRFKKENPDLYHNLMVRFDPDDPTNKLWIVKNG